MNAPNEERRPHTGAASIKSFRGDTTSLPGVHPVTASADTPPVLPWARALALSLSGPACRCGDYSRALADSVPAVWRDAYAQGHAAGLAEGLAQGSAHPAVVDSVTRMFPSWDGAEGALARSVTRFREWHTDAHKEVSGRADAA